MAPPRVVIVGGGFGGLNAALALARERVQVTLVDKRNFHLFQPLLYQVATGGLSPADISSPLRSVLCRCPNVRTLHGEVVDLDTDRRRVRLADAELPYDTLILATGVHHHYFGREDWAGTAPGLKTIEDATKMRSRILSAFERAEGEADPHARAVLLTFVIVGGGPTGVELAGAIGELARHTMRHEFRAFRSEQARIVLVEGQDRVLPGYPQRLSAAAARSLARLGVELRISASVLEVDAAGVLLERDGGTERLDAHTVLWAAGVRALPLAARLAQATGAALDEAGRVRVGADCAVPGRPEILVIGDMARVPDTAGGPLPGTAPVAIQQGRYVARLIGDRLAGRATPAFRYRHKGNLAVIGRAAAVADLGRLRFSGYPAWLLWLFVHIMSLVEYENRVLVFVQWGFSYLTRKRGARLITGPGEL